MTSPSVTSPSATPRHTAVRPSAVRRFTAEYRTDTSFVADPRPRLSWDTATDSPDWQQAHAELRLTRDGTVESTMHDGAESVLVDWPFAAIAAGEQVAVEVRVTGNDGGTTDWSAPLTLVGGYLDRPWQAQAIGLPVAAGKEAPLGQPGQLRHEFTVRAGLAKATLFATAHGVYQAEINGTEVDDHVLKPGWTAYADRLNHETTDVTATPDARRQRNRRLACRRLVHGKVRLPRLRQAVLRRAARGEGGTGPRVRRRHPADRSQHPRLAGHHGWTAGFQRHLRR